MTLLFIVPFTWRNPGGFIHTYRWLHPAQNHQMALRQNLPSLSPISPNSSGWEVKSFHLVVKYHWYQQVHCQSAWSSKQTWEEGFWQCLGKAKKWGGKGTFGFLILANLAKTRNSAKGSLSAIAWFWAGWSHLYVCMSTTYILIIASHDQSLVVCSFFLCLGTQCAFLFCCVFQWPESKDVSHSLCNPEPGVGSGILWCINSWKNEHAHIGKEKPSE